MQQTLRKVFLQSIIIGLQILHNEALLFRHHISEKMLMVSAELRVLGGL